MKRIVRVAARAAIIGGTIHVFDRYMSYVNDHNDKRFASIETRLTDLERLTETLSRNPALIGPIGGAPFSRSAITERLHTAGRQGKLGEEVARITAEMEQENIAFGLRPQPRPFR